MAPQQNRKAVTSMVMAHIHGKPIGPFETREQEDPVIEETMETAEIEFLKDFEAIIQ